MQRHKYPLIVWILCFLLLGDLALIAYGTWNYQRIINARVKVVKIGVDVWWDADKTNNTQFIDWGFLLPGENKTYILYIESNGTYPHTLISMTTHSWNPVTDQIILTWDAEGYVLGKGEMLPANFTLSVDPDITGIDEFNFIIVIEGSKGNR